MLYIRMCFDKSGTTELREMHRAAHRAYFKPNLEAGAHVRLVQAGPMCVSDDDDTNLGSFMILEAPSLADAQRFHEGDPFTQVGLYETVFIHRWDRHIG
ncbi:MAG TPA: YciI family protein [Paraburkholderia sp.]|jgi:hypothetical protein|nr:YciI family protein [Paraburkholderia sp.]